MISKSEIEAKVLALPSAKKGFSNKRIPESLVNDLPITDCWPWKGAKAKTTGYGNANYPGGGGRASSAHRVVWEVVFGPVPSGMQIDHQCHDPKVCAGGVGCPHRMCVNPNHLKPMSPAENTLRSNSASARNAEKTSCDNGHEFTADNTYVYTSTRGRAARNCRACLRAADRRHAQKRRDMQL